ncbi:MAG: hypothetical protein WCV58_02340 [Patescibacteria group bacterium]
MNLDSKFSKYIKLQAKTGSISHAYLIFGDFEPKALIEVYQIQAADIFFVEEAPIKISHIRELIHWLQLKPHSSSKKLVILPQIESMTLEAANSLLKVLEEPPSYAILVLQAFKKEKILPTILSRCQVIREGEKLNSNIPENYLSVKKINQMLVAERFNYVNEIIVGKNLNQFIDLWEAEIRLELLEGSDARGTLASISKARSLLLTNTSVKLLLENLVLKF